jgi:hypothetical protein
VSPAPAKPDVLTLSGPSLPGPSLPAWADRFLDPPGGEFFASRLWFDTLLAHAWPEDAEPLLAADPAGAALLLLARRKGRLASLTGDYSLAWRPLFPPGTTTEARREAGRSLAALARLGQPLVVELIDPECHGLADLLTGFRAGRVFASRFASAGNWYETLGEGASWASYLAARPPHLRTTVTRKLARARRDCRFDLVSAPGEALEAAIAAYEEVRSRSWKPFEPFPDFDAALLRATAAAGLLRLGVLRQKGGGREDGRAIAAQYWVLDRVSGPAGQETASRATVLKLAHDEALRAASPGTVLTAMMIGRLIEEDAVRVLDFGRGDDAYKQLWAGTRRQRAGFVLADPLSPAGAVALARQWAGPLVRRFRR